MIRSLTIPLAVLCAGLLFARSLDADEPTRAVPDFEREVEPLLRRHCYRCHGDREPKGGLDLTDRSAAFGAGDSGETAIVPGDPTASLLLTRVTDADYGDVMPLDGAALSVAEIDTLRRWIDAGAVWPEDSADRGHRFYRPPVRPSLAGLPNSDWVQTPIDRFVLRELDRVGLEPNPALDRGPLLRRVSLALTGLPPSPEEVERFVRDRSPGAYERAVDRLLASPAYGERWARPWLDLARYADSNGYQADQLRSSWPYRDWVVNAINADMPFDRFAVEQLAGDLLPNATEAQKIATGFHRTVTCNVEAGVDPEANRVDQVVDRVNTTGTVFLGTTLACAQCHDHKYDPISQAEYYRLFAYFNNTPLEVKLNRGTQYEFVGPTMPLPMTPKQLAERNRLDAELKTLRQRIADVKKAETGKAQSPTVAENESKEQELKTLRAKLNRLQKQRDGVKPVTTLVMVEREEPRETRIMNRGSYLDPGEPVTPGTPKVLHPLSEGLPPNRLGFARWLTARDNPLLARVTVNRWWAEIYGRGLVATPEDFGTQGEPPSHPELLDYVATEFLSPSDGSAGFSRKRIHRMMVLSAAFRQSPTISEKKRRIDPENRWLSRGPRFRLSAETVRDNALAVSGLLTHKIGGPPVMPYQPGGLWRAVGRNQPTWRTATDDDRFRRGLYTVWKRGAPYPSFTAFDAPDRSSCTVARPRTNTPLQALTLLNDPAYAEMAVALAGRMMTEADSESPEAIVRRGVLLCLSREPTARETEVLVNLFERERTDLADESETQTINRRVANLLPRLRDAEWNDRDLAAWFTVANVLLNWDETISR